MASEWEETGGTAVRGMSYEAGVSAGLRWALGDSDDVPIETAVEQ